MFLNVLGPIEARSTGAALDLGTPKQRALLCALALSLGRPVAVDTLIDLLWGGEAPRGVSGTLQSYVSVLRRVLEPHRERRRPAEILVTVAPGYALLLGPSQTDAGRFVAAVGTRHRQLAGTPLRVSSGMSRDELAEVVSDLESAQSLWRGRAYAELEYAPDAVAERARLEELRLVGIEDRSLASLALGQQATVAAELEALSLTQPLRERVWALRALALARSGRQADALQTLSTLRGVLIDELGLEPGIEVRQLQTAILRQDPDLDWREPPGPQRPATPGGMAPSPARRAVETEERARSREVPHETGIVGRQRELARLRGQLDHAVAGRAQSAVLVGEPGIGKSRLAAVMAEEARGRGFEVLVGRSSQDAGAPPLWLWKPIVTALELEVPTAEGDVVDPGARFRAWETVTDAVLARAATSPLMLVFEDLHWADTSSLGVLRLLVESMSDQRLQVLLTRRAHPEPTGALADLAETAARGQGLRLDLTGLDAEDAASVAEEIVGVRPSGSLSEALRRRTDGNPFFIVEYSRLVGPRGDLRELLAEAHPPRVVQDVLNRRLSRLPDRTVTTLRTGAVIGRQFTAETLGRAAGIEVDELLDVVEPAQAAGLLVEDGIDRFSFAHALVADTLLAGLTPSRRARIHARVAESLGPGTGREVELARHWLAAGPMHAAKAWRAAQVAAECSRSLHDHDRAAELLVAGLDLIGLDPSAALRDRYDLTIALIDAYRLVGRWTELTASVVDAVSIAEQLGEVELAAQAAIATNRGALWPSPAYGQVHAAVVAALERCLRMLPAEDGLLRCRVLLALANESYYVKPLVERRALVDRALAMASRIGDLQLRLEAHLAPTVALWAEANVAHRLAHAEVAVGLAKELGDEIAAVSTGALMCGVGYELGRSASLDAEVARLQAEAERLKLPYALVVLDSVMLPWLALAGDFDGAERLRDRISTVNARMSLPQAVDAVAFGTMALLRWSDRDADLVDYLLSVDSSPFPLDGIIVASMWRAGQRERAATWLADHPIAFEEATWFSVFGWSGVAEASLYLADPVLAQGAYDHLRPYSGQSVRAGSVIASGPVDAYLAAAAYTVGDREAAARHADHAQRQCDEWGIPIAGRWLARLRAQYGF